MIRFFANTIERILCLISGLVCAQIPQFIQHYMQQLSGRVDELRIQVDSMRNAAAMSGKTLEQFIQKFVKSTDPDFLHQGEVMSQAYNRYESLSAAYAKLQASHGLEQPFVFFYNIDGNLVKSTLANFSPGLPLTLDAGLYALAGIVVCYLIFAGLGRVMIRAKS